MLDRWEGEWPYDGDLAAVKLAAERLVTEAKEAELEASAAVARAAAKRGAADYAVAVLGLRAAGEGSAPADVSPPQDDRPGAGALSDSPESEPPPSRPEDVEQIYGELGYPPKPRTSARAQWNLDFARLLLKARGVISQGDLREAIQTGVGPAQIALKTLVERKEARQEGARGQTRYHLQHSFDEEPASRGDVEPAMVTTQSLQGAMHSLLLTNAMTVVEMQEAWPEHSEAEIRAALGENVRAGDVRKTRDDRYMGIP